MVVTILMMASTKATNGHKMRNIHFDVPEEFHRKVKMLCAMQGRTLKDFTESALREKVERDEKEMKSSR